MKYIIISLKTTLLIFNYFNTFNIILFVRNFNNRNHFYLLPFLSIGIICLVQKHIMFSTIFYIYYYLLLLSIKLHYNIPLLCTRLNILKTSCRRN